MRILIVKMTSFGDLLHVMPALTDLARARSGQDPIEVDWLVEESFTEVPHWHPVVHRVIPVAMRRWRGLRWQYARELMGFIKELRQETYDVVIDAQGLMKSAVLSRFAKLRKGGRRVGYSSRSLKESPAAWLYGQRVEVGRARHAVDRIRQLMSQAMQYELPAAQGDYALNEARGPEASPTKDANAVFLFHGTTWRTKHVPNEFWRALIERLLVLGFAPKLCWGNEDEQTRANELARGFSHVEILPKSTLTQLSLHLAHAQGAIAVDTGLGHLAAALGVPCVSLYGATDARLTGTYGNYQVQLQTDYHCSPCLLKRCPYQKGETTEPPCYSTLEPDAVIQRLVEQIDSR